MEKFSQKNISLILLTLSAIVFLSLFFTEAILIKSNRYSSGKIGFSQQKDERGHIKNNRQKRIEKLSEINGPRINQEAASISLSENKKIDKEKKCNTLPKKIWVFILAAYIGLLIYNLSANFKNQKEIRWVWEAVMTVIFILIWNSFDRYGENIWFPLYILKIGLIVYFLYLYFFTKNNLPYKE